jgi:flagellar biosynthesis protein
MDDEPKIAIALKYDRDNDDAPRVVATGKEKIAENIIALAKQHGIEIHEDKDLATILSKIELDTLIPFEAYATVAEILSFIYRKNAEVKYGYSNAD